MAASAHEFEAKMNDGSMRSMTEYKEWFQKESDSWSLIVSWNKLVKSHVNTQKSFLKTNLTPLLTICAHFYGH